VTSLAARMVTSSSQGPLVVPVLVQGVEASVPSPQTLSRQSQIDGLIMLSYPAALHPC
jgi:hypothetical protein